jgi:hypothetical protein
MYQLLATENPWQLHKIQYAGLFSNIPVLTNNIPITQRDKAALVFGSSGRREAVYKQADVLQAVCYKQGIRKIIDIGGGDLKKYWNYPGIEVVAKGLLNADEAALLMQHCRFGFVSYEDHLFGKSGVMAAYAGNGLVVVNFSYSTYSPKDGLKKGVHYLDAVEAKKNVIENQHSISENIFGWYQPRNAERHAEIIASAIKKDHHG